MTAMQNCCKAARVAEKLIAAVARQHDGDLLSRQSGDQHRSG